VTPAERRSAALLFGEELALGSVRAEELDMPQVEEAVRDRSIPSRLSRRFQQSAVKRGSLSYEAASVAPMLAARRAVLGDRADGPPRLLVRVDGFPHAQAGEFHEILREHEIPYLVAVWPHVPRDDGWRYLDTGELELLATLRDDGVAFGLQESLGGEPAELTERLDRAEAALAQHGVLPDVFVPPGNRFDPSEYQLLAKRFAVVTGGDETVARFGWHPTPLWRGETVYVPAYAPPGDRADAIRRLAEQQAALWVPVVLQWDDEDLIALCAQMRGLARPWDEFLAAVRASELAA